MTTVIPPVKRREEISAAEQQVKLLTIIFVGRVLLLQYALPTTQQQPLLYALAVCFFALLCP